MDFPCGRYGFLLWPILSCCGRYRWGRYGLWPIWSHPTAKPRIRRPFFSYVKSNGAMFLHYQRIFSSCTRNTFCRTRSLSNAPFSFLITWRSSSSKSATVYKISWKSSAILELFYHHTRPFTKSLLLAAAACQISCQSDTQIWRYSYLNFSHIWLEMSIQAPKLRVLGDFWP